MILNFSTVIIMLLIVFGIILIYLLFKRYGFLKALGYLVGIVLFVVVFLEGTKCIVVDIVAQYEAKKEKVIFFRNKNDDCRIDNLLELHNAKAPLGKILLMYVTSKSTHKKVPHLISCANNIIFDNNNIILKGSNCDIYNIDINISSGYIKPIEPLAIIIVENDKIKNTKIYSENLWDKYILIRSVSEYCKVFLNKLVNK